MFACQRKRSKRDINKTPDVVTNGEENLGFVYQYGERKAAPRSNTVLLGQNLSKTIEYKFLTSNKGDPNLNTVPTSYLIRSEVTRT